ncbi:MAG: type II toxin-antitoxin system HipA family toxin [Solirubrobacteraceae bacterium]
MADSGQVEVFVQIDDQDIAAGDLWMHRAGRSQSASFAYRPGYIGRDGAYALDPDLPLQTGQLQTPVGRSLFGAFSDAAPDRWGRTLIERTETVSAREEGRTARSFSEADYLLGARDDMRQGALRYRRPDTEAFLATEDTGVPALLQLGTLMNAAEALEGDDPTSQQLRLLLRGGSSLGGARPKAHVIGTDGRPAIAKFPSPKHDDWDVIRWEYVALELARQAGITTADHRLERLDGKPVIILRRFDRRADGQRVGYISAMTLLSAGDGQTFDYLDIAEQVEADSDRATDDLRELWTRAAYGRLISNTDDHLRNHGFLRGPAGWRLSPAFDINPNPKREAFATAFAGGDTGSLAPLIDNAELFRLDGDAIASTLARLTAASDQWENVALQRGLSSAAIAQMAPAFESTAREQARDFLGVQQSPSR